jgi:hypothetical protein
LQLKDLGVVFADGARFAAAPRRSKLRRHLQVASHFRMGNCGGGLKTKSPRKPARVDTSSPQTTYHCTNIQVQLFFSQYPLISSLRTLRLCVESFCFFSHRSICTILHIRPKTIIPVCSILHVSRTWSARPTGREVSSLPTGCVPLQPCGDLKTSRPRGTLVRNLSTHLARRRHPARIFS